MSTKQETFTITYAGDFDSGWKTWGSRDYKYCAWVKGGSYPTEKYDTDKVTSVCVTSESSSSCLAKIEIDGKDRYGGQSSISTPTCVLKGIKTDLSETNISALSVNVPYELTASDKSNYSQVYVYVTYPSTENSGYSATDQYVSPSGSYGDAIYKTNGSVSGYFALASSLPVTYNGIELETLTHNGTNVTALTFNGTPIY